MATLPGLQKGITKDSSPPATDTQLSPITIPDSTTLLTTKLHNEIVDNEDKLIDYVSGDASPDFIPQNAISTLVVDLSNKQPLDSDLTSIAGLTPVNDDIIQRKAGVWTNRTPIEFKTDLALVKADVGLSNVDNTSDADKPVSTATQTALDGKEDSLGFTPENIANKVITIGTPGNDTNYGTEKAIRDALDLKEDSLGFTPEDSANKGIASGYAGLDSSLELLLANFPTGMALQVLRRNGVNDALEFFTLSDLQGVTSINTDTTAAQIIAVGTGLDIVDVTNTHTLSIDTSVVTLTGVQTLTNKTIDGDLNTILDINETQMTVSIGAAGTVLTSNGVSMSPTYQAAGIGDVVGPGSATDNAIARFDGMTGKLIQNGIITIDDFANMIAIRSLQFTTFTSAPMGTTHIALVDNDFHINTTSGNSIQIMVDDVAEFQLDATTLDLMDNNLVMGTSFVQFSSIAEPGPSGSDSVGRVFMDVANQNHLSIKRNDDSIDLEAVDGVVSINADTTAAQIIAGTASRITVGTAAGTTTINIDTGYVGQTSITTLGTITIGVWNGTSITGANIDAASTDLTDTAVIVLTNKTNAWTIGLQDFSAVTLRIPVSATPSVTVNGDIAFDSLVTDFSTGLVKFFGIEEQGIVSMPIAEFTTPSDGFVVTYNATNDEFELVAAAGGGDMILAAVQTVTGAKTFEDTTLFLRNVANTFSASFVNTITADIIYTLPDAAGTVVITGLASQITLGAEVTGAITDLSDVTAKTGSGTIAVFDTSPTIVTPTIVTPTIASFVNATHDHEDAAGGGTLLSTAALSDTANIVYLNTANSYTAGVRQDFLGDTGGTAGLNVGGIAGNPTTQANGDIWLNTSTNQIFGRINGVDIDLGVGGGTGLTSINGDTTPAQIIAAGTGLDIADVDETHTLSIDSTVVTLIGSQTLTNKTIDGDLNTILDINETQMTVSVGAVGTVLTSNGVSNPPTYQAISPGDVVGPGSATDNAIARFDGITGKLIQDGTITIDDVANVAAIRSLVFTSFTMGPGVGTTHIALVDTDFHINTTTGNNIQLLIQGVTQYQFDEVSADFNNNNLIMGTAFIQFSSITEPGASGDDAVGTIFMDVGNQNHLSIRRNGDSIDLESTSFIGFTADADLDMGAFDINLAASQVISFDGATATQTIVGDTGGLTYNLPASDIHDFFVNSASRFTISETIINMLEPVNFNNGTATGVGSFISNSTLNSFDMSSGFIQAFFTNVGEDFRVRNAGGAGGDGIRFQVDGVDTKVLGVDDTAILILEANHSIPANDQIIGQLDFIDDSSTGVRRTYGQIRTLIEDPTNTGEDGQMFLSVIKAGVLTDYISINENNDGDITIDADIQMKGNRIDNTSRIQFDSSGFNTISDTATTLDIDTPSGGSIVFKVNTATEYSFNASELDMGDNNLNMNSGLITNLEAIVSENGPTASSGSIRLSGNDTISWRNGADNDDNRIEFTGSDQMFITINGAFTYQFTSTTLGFVDAGFLSMGSILATAGKMRMPKATGLGWRNNANNDNLEFLTNISDEFVASINGTIEYTFGATEADWQANDLVNVNNIEINALGRLFLDGGSNTYIVETASGTIDIVGDDSVLMTLREGVDDEVILPDTDLLIQGSNRTALITMEAAHTSPTDGQDIGVIDFVDDNDAAQPILYAQIRAEVQIPDQTDESGRLILSVNESDSLQDYIVLAGESSSIEFLTQINTNGFNIQELGNLQFIGTGSTPAATVQYITANAGGMKFNVPTGDTIQFFVNGLPSMFMDSNSVDIQQRINMTDGKDIAIGTGTGTKIGTVSNQKIGFWQAVPIVQPAHIADATDAASAITQLNLLLAQMASTGLQASS